MTATTRRRRAKTFVQASASTEPVVIGGALRTVLYVILGTRLDARTLSEVVVVAETLFGILVRHFVSPIRRKKPTPRAASAKRSALRAA